jgi:hypothetical protein
MCADSLKVHDAKMTQGPKSSNKTSLHSLDEAYLNVTERGHCQPEIGRESTLACTPQSTDG